jgi:LysR family transcriptional regulator, transcriptional activator of the cysJI operon
VNLAFLKLFKEIAQTRSMTRAAAHCGISQSAASQHVHEVESRLGAPLLDRSTRPMELTPAGRRLMEFARDVLRREEQFRRELAELKQQVEGTVRVASIYSVGLSEMSRVREQFARRYPEAQLLVEYMRPGRIYDAVLDGSVDLGLVSYPEPRRDFAVIPWREEQMAVAVAPGHPLAARAVVVPADLEGQDFIGFDEDLPIRRMQDRFLREQGVTVNLSMQFDNIQMIKEAVALGSGISILPARTMQAEIEQGRLAAVPLDAPGLVRPVGIVYRRRKKFGRAVKSFLDMLQSDAAA